MDMEVLANAATRCLAEIDADIDTLTNLQEFRLGLNPRISNLRNASGGIIDSDGDGYSFSYEYAHGTDPAHYDWPTDPLQLVALFSSRPSPNLLPQDAHGFKKVELRRPVGGSEIHLKWKMTPGIR